MSYFPIVYIGPDVTVNELREKRPFLWLVMRAICSKSAARQKALGLEVRKTLGTQMLVEGIKSLDLLLGCLVFAGWGHYYIATQPVITTVIQNAISLASDLGLTKPAPTERSLVMLNYSAQGCPKPPHLELKPPRKIEERRTIIGLFLISSVYDNFIHFVNLPCETIPTKLFQGGQLLSAY